MFWCFSQEILFRFFICKNWHVGTRAIFEQSSEPSFPLSRKAVFYVYFSPFSIISLTVLTLISTAVGLYWPVLQKMCDVLQLFKVSSYLQNFFSIIFCLNDLFVYNVHIITKIFTHTIGECQTTACWSTSVPQWEQGVEEYATAQTAWMCKQTLLLRLLKLFCGHPFSQGWALRSFPCGTLRSFPF